MNEPRISEGRHPARAVGWQLDFTIKSLRVCGWKGDDVYNIEALDADVILVVEHEQYEGETQPKIKFINDPNFRGLGKKMDADRAKSIAARVKNRIAGVADDDDIPF